MRRCWTGSIARSWGLEPSAPLASAFLLLPCCRPRRVSAYHGRGTEEGCTHANHRNRSDGDHRQGGRRRVVGAARGGRGGPPRRGVPGGSGGERVDRTPVRDGGAVRR